MRDVNEPPLGAKFRAVCWEDLDDVRRWLRALEEQVSDLHGVAGDRVREKRRRVLSRHEAGRKVRAAWRAIIQLFEAAKAGFRPPEPFGPPPSPPPSSEESEAPFSERRVLEPPPEGEDA